MINAGTAPAYNNVEALTQQYYSQCLQTHIEALELCLDEGLGLVAAADRTLGTEFDTKDLLRMDTATKIKSAVEGLKGIFAPNEVRAEFDLPPVAGGDAVYLQQQNYSIEALNKRDSKEDPFSTAAPAPAPADADDDDDPDDDADDAAAEERALEIFRYADEARPAA
jgi:phage portal protein BeeE